MRSWLPWLLLGTMLACRSASIGYSGSSLVTPVESGAADSFFPDGPTAGYLLLDRLNTIYISPHGPPRAVDTSPKDGIGATPQRLRDFRKVPSNSYGQRISFFDGGKTVLSSDHVLLGASTEGDSWISAWIDGNPKATMYRISSPDYPHMLDRIFPSNADAPLTIQVKRLGSTRYAWRCRGWCMSYAMYFSFDDRRTWQRDTSPPQKAFEINPKQRLAGSPVLLDIRVAEPGCYWFARYQLP